MTDELKKRLKTREEFKAMKSSIVENFIKLSDRVTKTHDLILNSDNDFQSISKELSKFAIELYKEAIILKEEGKKKEGELKIAQATFLSSEAYTEHKILRYSTISLK